MTIPAADVTMIKIQRDGRLYFRLKWFSFALVCLEILSYLLLLKLDEMYDGSVVPPVIFYPVLFLGFSAPIMWLGIMIWSGFLVRRRALWLLFAAPVIFAAFAAFYILSIWSLYSNYCNAQPLRKVYAVDHNGHVVDTRMVPACAGP